MKIGSTRRGFTIVELLVVISIIAMLSAILLPAVNSARAAARQMACIQNQGQIGKAMAQYAATKGQLPSYISEVDPGVPVGWAYRILPQIDKQTVKDALGRAGSGLLGTDLQDAYLQLLVCPDDAITMDLTLGPMSYAANGGLLDEENTAGTPPDWRDNGSLSRTFQLEGSSSTAPQSNTIDFISSHDGVSTTLLLAENVSTPSTSFDRPSWLPADGALTSETELKEYEISQVILWSVDITPIDDPNFAGFVAGSGRNSDGWDITNHSAFVPSSTHAGGFVATYCDGHTQFMSDLLDYGVYARLMTSNGINARPSSLQLSDITNVSSGQTTPEPPYQSQPVSEFEMNP